MKSRLMVMVLALLAAACNMAVPQITPTVAPTLTTTFSRTPAPTSTVTRSFTPSVTYTLTPSETASATPSATFTPSPTASDTLTPSATPTDTATPSATFTPSPTPSDTLTPSTTPTDTATPTDTLTPPPTASDTLTPSPTPTDTPVPSLTPTDTVTPTNTLTPSPSATFSATASRTRPPSATPRPPTDTPRPSRTNTPRPTSTPRPSQTNTPRPTSTPRPSRTNTPRPTSTPLPSSTPLPPTDTPLPPPTPTHTITPLPSPTPTNTITPLPGTVEPVGFRTPTDAPTINATPTFVTAAPGTAPAPVTVTPPTSNAPPIRATVTLAPTDTTPTFVTVTPPTEAPTPSPTVTLPNPLTLAIALRTGDSGVTASGFLLPFASTTFAINPVDSSRTAVVDTRGLLYLFSGGVSASQGVRVRVSPFVDFEPQSADDNQVRVVQIGWSPDGSQLAFLVDAERDDRDGVWILDNPQANSISNARQVFRECPPPMQSACTVIIGGEPSRYNSLRFDWNRGSSALLIALDLPGEGRHAFTVVPNANDPVHLQPIYRYGSVSWSWDGSRVLVSGAGPDGRSVIAWLDPASGAQSVILDGTGRGLWLQDAVERPDGQIVALGSVDGASSAMSLYDASGRQISAAIGMSAPERVTWSPDRSAVLVVVNDGGAYHYYVAQVDGQVREITEGFAGALSVEWVAGSAAAAQATPSGGSLVQSRYGLHINGVVQVVAPAGVNLRAAPSTQAQVLASMKIYDTLMIVGGPVEGQGLIWWQVRNGGGVVGWSAEAANDVQLLSPKGN